MIGIHDPAIPKKGDIGPWDPHSDLAGDLRGKFPDIFKIGLNPLTGQRPIRPSLLHRPEGIGVRQGQGRGDEVGARALPRGRIITLMDPIGLIELKKGPLGLKGQVKEDLLVLGIAVIFSGRHILTGMHPLPKSHIIPMMPLVFSHTGLINLSQFLKLSPPNFAIRLTRGFDISFESSPFLPEPHLLKFKIGPFAPH